MIQGVPFPLPPEMESALREAYLRPPRAYHHLGHVEEVLAAFARVPAKAELPASVLAILYHDAVYAAGRADNEAKSAELARESILRYMPEFSRLVPRVVELIHRTAEHGKLAAGDVDEVTAHFLDSDMAILGAPPERFADYERAIAEEYAFLPVDVFRAGRQRFLSRLLASPAIYLSDFFRERLEPQARENLRLAVRRSE